MHQFFARHRFIESLVKRIIRIGVTWTVVMFLVIFTLFGLAFLFAPSSEPDPGVSYSYIYGDGYNELLSIPITGLIVGSEEEASSFGIFEEAPTVGYTIKEQLYKASDDSRINGVILEINSPGGTIYGSRAIADGVAYYREKTGNPVYAFISGMGASGAYWAASSTDKIFADYGSDIGSVGVIMGPFQFYNQILAEDGGILGGGVITQNGIESTYITAGKSKDAGSPYRRLTAEELASFQQSVNNEYDNFVSYVASHRKIPEATLRNTIGAMAYDNKTAQSHKLIDQTMSREEAYEKLARAAGIEDNFTILREERTPGFLESLLQAATQKQNKSSQAQACGISSSILAYHGDVATLCPVKRN